MWETDWHFSKLVVDGNEGKLGIASTASVATLAIFDVFGSLARKSKILVGIVPNPY